MSDKEICSPNQAKSEQSASRCWQDKSQGVWWAFTEREFLSHDYIAGTSAKQHVLTSVFFCVKENNALPCCSWHTELQFLI